MWRVLRSVFQWWTTRIGNVFCFIFWLFFFGFLWFASLFWRDLQCLIGKISKCTTCNLCNNEKRFSRISSSFTSAVHLTKRRRSPQRTSMKMKRRRRTRLPERCCHVVRCKLSLHKSIFSYQHLPLTLSDYAPPSLFVFLIDSSQEYTDSTGIDVHEFLVNTLKNNPRYGSDG